MTKNADLNMLRKQAVVIATKKEKALVMSAFSVLIIVYFCVVCVEAE